MDLPGWASTMTDGCQGGGSGEAEEKSEPTPEEVAWYPWS